MHILCIQQSLQENNLLFLRYSTASCTVCILRTVSCKLCICIFLNVIIHPHNAAVFSSWIQTTLHTNHYTTRAHRFRRGIVEIPSAFLSFDRPFLIPYPFHAHRTNDSHDPQHELFFCEDKNMSPT
jgi:hypothetical protein